MTIFISNSGEWYFRCFFTSKILQCSHDHNLQNNQKHLTNPLHSPDHHSGTQSLSLINTLIKQPSQSTLGWIIHRTHNPEVTAALNLIEMNERISLQSLWFLPLKHLSPIGSFTIGATDVRLSKCLELRRTGWGRTDRRLDLRNISEQMTEVNYSHCYGGPLLLLHKSSSPDGNNGRSGRGGVIPAFLPV